MSTSHSGNVEPSVDLEEHRSISGVNAKAVVPYNFGAAALTPTPTPLLDLAYDYVGMSSPDGNGNYTVFEYKQGGSGGTIVRTLTYTYDVSSNVTSITRS